MSYVKIFQLPHKIISLLIKAALYLYYLKDSQCVDQDQNEFFSPVRWYSALTSKILYMVRVCKIIRWGKCNRTKTCTLACLFLLFLV